MIGFPALYSELESLVATVWPDVVSGGEAFIREADDVEGIPFQELVDLHLPFAVIVFPTPMAVEMGEANRCFELPCEFWYVARTTLGSSALWAKAEAMASALWTAGRDGLSGAVTEGQVRSDPMPRPVWGTSQPVNRFLREKKSDILAAGALATILVGESPE